MVRLVKRNMTALIFQCADFTYYLTVTLNEWYASMANATTFVPHVIAVCIRPSGHGKQADRQKSVQLGFCSQRQKENVELQTICQSCG